MPDDRVHPEIRRALGAADLSTSKADDHAAKAEAHARRAEELLGKPRGKQPSLAEIDAKLDRALADDQRFDDPEENTLSMHLPGGTRVSAKGIKAIRATVAIALLLAIAAGLFLVGRVTAPHRSETPAAPK